VTDSWFDPPTGPLDVWAAARADTHPEVVDDFVSHHRRGYVVLPYEINPDPGERKGDVVEAWVCCDPSCAGVELNVYDLDRNHHCCHEMTAVQRKCKALQGSYHGHFTAYWQPDAVGGAR
jgi:hypothetical protein